MRFEQKQRGFDCSQEVGYKAFKRQMLRWIKPLSEQVLKLLSAKGTPCPGDCWSNGGG
jgi:hypothetical protein